MTKSKKTSNALFATAIVALTAMYHFGRKHQVSTSASASASASTSINIPSPGRLFQKITPTRTSGITSDQSWTKLENNGLLSNMKSTRLVMALTTTTSRNQWEMVGNTLQGEEEEDYFGQCVTISNGGNVIAVSSGSLSSGRVKVYRFNQEIEIPVWEQLGSDILNGDVRPQTSTTNDLSIAMSTQGDIVVIGAPHNMNGHVRIFRYTEGQWEQEGQDLDGALWDEEEDFFGKSVGINGDGNRVVVGGPLNNDNGFWSGHTKVFEYNQNTELWKQLGSDILGDNGFNWSGDSVDINTKGDVIVIGAPLNDGNNGGSSGLARIYRYTDEQWQQEGQDLTGDGEDDSFGSSVGINGEGNRVVIGGPFNDNNGSNSGHVKVFEYHQDTELWEQLGSDILGEGEANFSGHAVDINDKGDIVVIGDGNYGHSTTGYSARIFRYTDGQWQQKGQGLDEDKSKYDQYYSTSISINSEGNRVVVGADRNDDNGLNSGQIKVFEFREVNNNDEHLPASPPSLSSAASSHHSTSVLMLLTVFMAQFLCGR